MQGCKISDDWTFKGMRTIWLENELLRIGILADRGSDIFEFRYKPQDLNLLLELPDRLRNLSADFTQMRDTTNQFEDHYYGGWQEILPNSQAFNYRGASLGQHGEISLIPWKYSILENNRKSVSVKLWCSPVRVPLRIEKTITLNAGESRIHLSEKLTNTGKSTLDIMWGHHIALGLPFIEDPVVIDTNAEQMYAEPEMPDNRRFMPGIKTEWPNAKSVDGKADDASVIPGKEGPQYSELSYLNGFPGEAYYSVINKRKKLAFHVEWDPGVFRSLWCWQERNAMMGFPWWGNCYTLALEPWSSNWTKEPREAIDRGDWLKIDPGQEINTFLNAGVRDL